MECGSIAAGSADTAYAARDILHIGGNAVDAAVAAVFVSMVAESTLTGPAGGGVMLVHMAGEAAPTVIDFFVDTPPSHTNLDFFGVDVDFGATLQTFHIGKSAVAVPGTLAGLLHAHKTRGVLPLADVLSPAIKVARDGVVINSQQAFAIQMLEPILRHDPNCADIYFRKGRLLVAGDRFYNPEFADFLEKILESGADYLYKGDGATLLLDYLQPHGLLTRESLANYKVIERQPLRMNFQGYSIYTNPAPSIGGTLIAFLLNLYERSKLEKITRDDFLRSMLVADFARFKICHDSNDTQQINQLLSADSLAYYTQLFSSGDIPAVADSSSGFGSTTHLSLIDRAGNAVSVTTTNGEGCGCWVKELGFMPNNMLGEDDLHPHGFFQWNQIRRLATMMAPTIITKNDQPYLVLGSGGSKRIRAALTQVIINHLYNSMSLPASIQMARMHVDSGVLYHEPGVQFDVNKIGSLKVKAFDDINLYFGGVNAVTPNEAVADLRREGTAIFGDD